MQRLKQGRGHRVMHLWEEVEWWKGVEAVIAASDYLD